MGNRDQAAPYRARITNHDGTVISAGTFVGTGTATMRCNLNSSVLRPDAASFVVLDPAGTAVVWADLR